MSSRKVVRAVFGEGPDLRRDPLAVYLAAMREYGAVAPVRVGPPRVGFEFTVVTEPAAAQHVLATEARRYVKDAPAWQEFRRLFGNGLLLLDGDLWRQRRRVLQPLFTPQRVDVYVPRIALAAARLVDSWAGPAACGGPVDLAMGAVRFALDSLSVVFGPDVSTAVDVVARAVPLLNEFAAGRALSFVRPPLWLPTPANRRAREAQRRLRGYVTDLLRERKTAGGGGDDLIDRARMATDPETGERLNDTAVRDEVLIFLLAGHETTGSALALTLHALGRHPEVQRRIRTETFQVLGGDHPTAEQVPQLRYTSAAVSEALRLYPPGHALVRRAMEPDVLAGAPVPRGRVLAVSTYAIHHNPTVWPNPEVFEPERFLGPGEARHRYAHLPFGGGPRSCIAARLAFTELVVAVAAVVRAYVIDSLAPQPPIRARITLEPAGPLPARLTPVAAELGRPPAPASAT